MTAVSPAPGIAVNVADKGQMSFAPSHHANIPALYQSNFADEVEMSNEPGPGAYECTSSFGFQNNSMKFSASATSLKAKNVCQKRYLNKNSAKVFQGMGTPGPGTYQLKSSLSNLCCPVGKAKQRPPADFG